MYEYTVLELVHINKICLYLIALFFCSARFIW